MAAVAVVIAVGRLPESITASLTIPVLTPVSTPVVASVSAAVSASVPAPVSPKEGTSLEKGRGRGGEGTAIAAKPLQIK